MSRTLFPVVRYAILRFMKRVIILLLVAASSLFADYSFEVPQNISHVRVLENGSIDIEYFITFNNLGQPIDIVDVGLPNRYYRIDTATADLDGNPITDIRKSEVVDIGIEVHLGSYTIPTGSTGTLHVKVNNPRMVYRDDEDPNYASLRFTPTWYGGQYTRGETRYEIYFHLPKAVQPNEPRWHKVEPQVKTVTAEGIMLGYIIERGSPSRSNMHGVSFPATTVSSVVEPPSKFARFLKNVKRFIGAVIAALIPLACIGGFIGLIVLVVIADKKRKMKYLPASVGVEGVEVRRGLTVPEVAALKELPVNRVLALMLFGLIKKGRARVADPDPLKIEEIPGEEKLLVYEEEFLASIRDDKKLDQGEAEKVLIKLIKNVRKKMKGFNRKKTLKYYDYIMKKAWSQVGSDNYENSFEWLLLDTEAERKIPEAFGGHTVRVPVWWGHYTGHGSGTSGGGISGLNFAHSIVSGIEGFSNNLVSSVTGLAQNVTAKTNPVPVSSRGSSGGGGCACACACAGCACACAGGGR